MSEREGGLSRKDFIATFMLGAAAVIASRQWKDHGTERQPQPYDVFKDSKANEIANTLGIHAGSFFAPPGKRQLRQDNPLWMKMTGLTETETLLPLYPPAVMGYKANIYKAADRYGIPPNILATIVTIESAGNKDAVSHAGALGLGQVMPFHFSENSSTQQRLHPDTNLEASAKVLAGNKKIFIDSNDADPRGWRNIAMAYNGGPNAVNRGLLPTETAQYGDHFMRFVLIGEVAQRLREQGYSDAKIVDALISTEVDARGYALQQRKTRGGFDAFAAAKNLGRASVSMPRELSTDYERYKNGAFQYSLPLAPSLRVWACLGGSSLLQSVRVNNNPHAWKNPNTAR